MKKTYKHLLSASRALRRRPKELQVIFRELIDGEIRYSIFIKD